MLREHTSLSLQCGAASCPVRSSTYGGHGEQMAVFASQVKVDGKPLAEMGLSDERWDI